jgi:hypothetical protein
LRGSAAAADTANAEVARRGAGSAATIHAFLLSCSAWMGWRRFDRPPAEAFAGILSQQMEFVLQSSDE